VSIAYESLHEFQVVNHFDNNICCTSKFGLSMSLRTLQQDGFDSDEFFPRCYDLGDQLSFEDFLEDYQFTAVLFNLSSLLLQQVEGFLCGFVAAAEGRAPEALDKVTELRLMLAVHVSRRRYLDFNRQLENIVN